MGPAASDFIRGVTQTAFFFPVEPSLNRPVAALLSAASKAPTLERAHTPPRLGSANTSQHHSETGAVIPSKGQSTSKGPVRVLI